jgi:hypothetical protein
MNIAWVYLDKKAAALKAVKDYSSMDRIIQNYISAIENARTRMDSVRSSAASLAPGSAHKLSSDEERIVEAIDSINVIDERYRCAVDYMNWFIPAWSTLNEAEQIVLSEFYRHDNISRSILLSNLSSELFLERSQIYRIKDKAIERLALLLYGH